MNMVPEPPIEIVHEVPRDAIPLREERGEWVIATRAKWQEDVKERRNRGIRQ